MLIILTPFYKDVATGSVVYFLTNERPQRSWQQYCTNMKRSILVIIFYGMIPLAIINLYGQGWLEVPQGLNVFPFLSAIILALLGFAFSIAGWRASMAMFGFRVVASEAIAAMGLSVPGKYIPGKIWTIVGRASYSALKHNWAVSQLSYISFYAQFISLWFGAALGLLGVVWLGGPSVWVLGLGIALVVMTGLLYSAPGQHWVFRLIARFSKKTIKLPQLQANKLQIALFYYFMTWSCWIAGFALFANAFPGVSLNPIIGLGFALAGVIGIVTLVAPGGIGTREAVLTAFLLLEGSVAPEQATMIAIGSRVWFLTGELGLFAAGIVADRLWVKRQS